MRKVFNNRELAHVWAGQKQDEGRGSHMFFNGASIFSYGRHYEIARVITGKGSAGAPVVLFNGERSSVTTEGKHKHHVRRALNHAEVFRVPELRADSAPDHSANICAWLADVEKSRAAALRAVKYANVNVADAARAANTAARYVEIFKKELPAKLRAEVRRVASLVKSGKLFTAAELAKMAAAENRRAESDKRRQFSF